MEVLARAAALVIEPNVREREREAEIHSRLDPVLAGGGPVVLLQPVVRLSDGVRVGAEALSRFPAEWDLPPTSASPRRTASARASASSSKPWKAQRATSTP